MTTDDLARLASMGVLAALLAFEFVAAMHSWIAARKVDGKASRDAPWLSQPYAIRAHLAARRRQLEAERWRYSMLRTTRHGREVRDAIRGLREHPRRDSSWTGRRQWTWGGGGLAMPTQRAWARSLP